MQQTAHNMCKSPPFLDQAGSTSHSLLLLGLLLRLLQLLLLPPLLFLILRRFCTLLEEVAYRFSEFFPPAPVQSITQFSEAVHLTPTVPSPFTPGHIDDEISFRLIVMYGAVVLTTGSVGETAHLPLRYKCCMRTYPRMSLIKIFKCVLLLMLPLHVFLLVMYWVPPKVEETVCPGAAADEEGAEVEA